MPLPQWRSFGAGAKNHEGWPIPSTSLPRTSLRVEKGGPIHWNAHLTRLHEGAQRLEWDLWWLRHVEAEVLEWISEVSRGTIPFLACRIQAHSDALSIKLEALPEPIWPYRLVPMPHPLGEVRNDDRSALKGILGPWNLDVLSAAHQGGAEDSLLLWPDGTVAETAIAACAILRGKELVLPPLQGRVRSIAESLDLPGWADAKGWEVLHAPIGLEEIHGGQLWCMNALRGLWQAEVVQSF